jgi:putative hemolysin
MPTAAADLQTLAQKKLAQANVRVDLDPYDRRLLEKAGAALFVCNQLLPGLDEWILLSLLDGPSRKAHIVHPYPMPPARSLRPQVLPQQPARLPGEPVFRVGFARRVVKAVREGAAVGLVVDFSDNPLSPFGRSLYRSQVLRQVRKAGLPVVPVHLLAERPPGGLLRRALPALPQAPTEAPLRVCVRVGQPIRTEDLELFPKNRPWVKFLQAKIFALGSPFEVHPGLFTPGAPAGQEPLAEPVEAGLVSADIAALRPEHQLLSRGPFDVFVAPFAALPHAMFEIGRLRELTFRAAGEGGGKARDMDEYDLYYLQLVIWDREARRIVGGYRLGQGDLIFRKFGINGFYTSSLFKFKKGFHPLLQEAVELGRSYIVPDYQKHRLPLFLLWKGILHFLMAHPHYRYLYGPVSVSKDYSDVSRALIVEFVRRYFFDKKLARHVAPRKPFRVRVKAVDTRLLAQNLRGEFEALEDFVENIEPAHFKVPVLFRQYLKQNARFIAFNVDPLFSGCLDGLMILDIRNLPASTIETLR